MNKYVVTITDDKKKEHKFTFFNEREANNFIVMLDPMFKTPPSHSIDKIPVKKIPVSLRIYEDDKSYLEAELGSIQKALDFLIDCYKSMKSCTSLHRRRVE
jgi:hypothetical protein